MPRQGIFIIFTWSIIIISFNHYSSDTGSLEESTPTGGGGVKPTLFSHIPNISTANINQRRGEFLVLAFYKLFLSD